jgi:hypothetical protein
MTVKAVKKITKTSDQDWSGVYIKNVSSTLNSLPDARDQQNMFSNTEIRSIRNNIRENVRGANGYEGWDREYVGNNELRLIYYFEDRISANTFIHASPLPQQNVNVRFSKIIKEKTINYNSQWILIDENGQEEVIVINND